MAEKKLFCKLDCSQAYHCLQMAHQWSVEMLTFNLASRFFAYPRLAEDLTNHCQVFQTICVIFCTPSSKQINAHNMLMTLAQQQIRLNSSSAIHEHFLNASRLKYSNSPWQNATLEQKKMNSLANIYTKWCHPTLTESPKFF